MRIVYYCQHVLGVGHLHRSLEICRALSANHELTMIIGGAPLNLEYPGVTFFQLPGLMMDSSFENLAPCDPSANLEDIKRIRKRRLFEFFSSYQPEVFVVELYPFGRKAFRFELDHVLEALRDGQLPQCRVFCSLRDILVERTKKEQFEERIVTTLNSLFDGLIIHGDELFISLEETFSRMRDISIPAAYSGYVTKPLNNTTTKKRRNHFGIDDDKKLVVASIGGGNVGGELLRAVSRAVTLLNDDSIFLQIFTGPYAEEDLYNDLSVTRCRSIRVDRFTDEFPEWVAAADLSVSMAGYNTCMNVLAAGTPALFYPFLQNHEQRMRVERLAELIPCKQLSPEDLEPETLAEIISRRLKVERYRSPIKLDGAAKTATIIENWLK